MSKIESVEQYEQCYSSIACNVAFESLSSNCKAFFPSNWMNATATIYYFKISNDIFIITCQLEEPNPYFKNVLIIF